MRKFRRRLLVIIALLLSLGLLMVLLRGWIWTSFPLGAAAAFAYSSQKRQLENLARSSTSLTGPTRVSADENGVQFETASARLWYTWGNYQYFLDASDGLGLVTGGGSVLRWIPTSAFQGQAEREGLLGLARQAGLAPTS
ncbi:MAG TPA: hypothetical protein VJR05_02805 [Acidimicrobiia bacterium]|nr:hypothetical protein [Acidimicrobiia bacterium]